MAAAQAVESAQTVGATEAAVTAGGCGGGCGAAEAPALAGHSKAAEAEAAEMEAEPAGGGGGRAAVHGGRAMASTGQTGGGRTGHAQSMAFALTFFLASLTVEK